MRDLVKLITKANYYFCAEVIVKIIWSYYLNDSRIHFIVAGKNRKIVRAKVSKGTKIIICRKQFF